MSSGATTSRRSGSAARWSACTGRGEPRVCIVRLTARERHGPFQNRPRSGGEPGMLERLTAADLSMVWPEDFGWPQDIGALAIIDGSMLLDADGRLRTAEVREQIARRLHLFPRFRQLLCVPRRGLGWP